MGSWPTRAVGHGKIPCNASIMHFLVCYYGLNLQYIYILVQLKFDPDCLRKLHHLRLIRHWLICERASFPVLLILNIFEVKALLILNLHVMLI